MTTTHYLTRMYDFQQLIEFSKTTAGEQLIRIAVAQWAGWDYQYNHFGELFGFLVPKDDLIEKHKQNHGAAELACSYHVMTEFVEERLKSLALKE